MSAAPVGPGLPPTTASAPQLSTGLASAQPNSNSMSTSSLAPPISASGPSPISPASSVSPASADSYQQTQSELDRLKQRLLSLAVAPEDGSAIVPQAAQLVGDADALRVQLSQLAQDRARLEAEIKQAQQLYDQEKRLHSSAAQAVTALRKRADDLERLLTEKQNELSATQRDLQIMGEKLVDEIERRAELQHSKEAVQDELEQLTSQLFEEANVMVAKEAQKSFQMEKTSKMLEEELAQTKLRLEAESNQLRELRKKMQEFMAERDAQEQMVGEALAAAGGPQNNPAAAAVAAALTLGRAEPGSRSSFVSNDDPRRSIDSRTGEDEDDTLDPIMAAEFIEFVATIPTMRLNAIGKLPFMKSALEDDIEPVLRFGGNPQVSTKKVIDSIIENRIFIQEMPPQGTVSAPSPGASVGPQQPGVALSSGPPGPGGIPGRPPSGVDQPSSSLSATISSVTGLNLSSVVGRDKSVWERLQGLPGVGPPSVCQACGNQTPNGVPCRFQFRLSDTDPWSALCGVCRDRLVSACDFYNFLRHVKSGLMQNRPALELYREALRLKRQMFYARNGAVQMASQERGFGKWKPRPVTMGRSATPDPTQPQPAALRDDTLRRSAAPASPSPLNPAAYQQQQQAPQLTVSDQARPPSQQSAASATGQIDLPQLAMPPLKRGST